MSRAREAKQVYLTALKSNRRRAEAGRSSSSIAQGIVPAGAVSGKAALKIQSLGSGPPSSTD
jgi:uncharacterized phosphosugar-binding protein